MNWWIVRGCRRRGRRVQNQGNCNGRHGRRVTWSVSKRWVNRDLFWARTLREKRTSGPGLIKEEEGRNVVYCLMWRLFSTSVPPSLPSSHSAFVMQHFILCAYHEHTGWYTLKLTPDIARNVSTHQALGLLICAWPFVWKLRLGVNRGGRETNGERKRLRGSLNERSAARRSLVM